MSSLLEYKQLVQTKIFQFFQTKWNVSVCDRANFEKTSMESSHLFDAVSPGSSQTGSKKRKLEVCETGQGGEKKSKHH